MDSLTRRSSAEAAAADAPDIHIGVLVAHSPKHEADTLDAWAMSVVDLALDELARATQARWYFHPEEPVRLEGDEPRRPSDFLDEASMRMAEGPYDMVLVVTDVGIVSRKQRVEPGLVSPISRVAVLSTRRMLMTPRGQPIRELDDRCVGANAAGLLLHMIGHMLGLSHTASTDGVMAPFRFDPSRHEVPRFDAPRCRRMARRVDQMPERELRSRQPLALLWFHLSAVVFHPANLVRTLFRNRAPLLSLALPGLSTAAIAPAFLLVFTAEIWDVGFGLDTATTTIYAVVSVLAATVYLVKVQDLFFPHKEKGVVTEHIAVVNASVLLTILMMVVGLFVMVGGLMLLIELWIFPEGLMSTWPTLEVPEITLADQLRLAAFIATLGVTTGALAGGLESRTLIRHLALFLNRP